MTRRMAAIAFLLLVTASSADAQPSGKVYRVGLIVTPAPTEIRHLSKALEDGLWELGYVEGRNLTFERRFAEGRQEPRARRPRERVRYDGP